MVAINVGGVVVDVIGLQLQEDRRGKSLRPTGQRPKTLAPGPAREWTLSETSDRSPVLSAEPLSPHLQGD